MFGIGMPEMLLILAIALIVIGPQKLPDLAKSLGRAIAEFRRATAEIKATMEIDEELKGVQNTFKNIENDVKNAVTPETTRDPQDHKTSGQPDRNQIDTIPSKADPKDL